VSHTDLYSDDDDDSEDDDAADDDDHDRTNAGVRPDAVLYTKNSSLTASTTGPGRTAAAPGHADQPHQLVSRHVRHQPLPRVRLEPSGQVPCGVQSRISQRVISVCPTLKYGVESTAETYGAITPITTPPYPLHTIPRNDYLKPIDSLVAGGWSRARRHYRFTLASCAHTPPKLTPHQRRQKISRELP
jgi:hypothetical protein